MQGCERKLDISIPSGIRDILYRLERNGFEAYLVGGCVRDSILGIMPDDYDIATNAFPDEIMHCIDGLEIVDKTEQSGTVTVLSGGEYADISTFRADVRCADGGKQASVKYADTLEEDLTRRDFTVNAMAYSDKTGIVDLFGGQQDLFNGKVRCIGEPAVRFEEDALRILRALRLASMLGFRIDPLTASSIHEKKQLLKDISTERVTTELTKFVMGTAPCDLMIEFDDVFCTIIPEFAKCIGFDQRSRYHVYDVWEHTAHAVQNSRAEKDIRLALLFHDIEKPTSCRIDEEGHGHFPGHEKRSAETAERIMRRLKFPGDIIKNTCELIRYHYITPVDDRRVVKHLISAMGTAMFEKLIEVMKGDSRAKQGFCLERVNTLDAMKYLSYEIIRSGECCTLSGLAINSDDLIDIGFESKEISDALSELLMMVIDEKIPNERGYLIEAARDFSQRGKKRVFEL